jgi:isopentenyl-diphosphate delta-isomerase
MSDRKKDHIELAFASQVQKKIDGLYYEPMLSAHPDENTDISVEFLSQKMKAPLWISSMTGGTAKAKTINTNLAKVANKYGLGMGLGSCRPLLNSQERLSDFDLKHIIGDFPFYANLGVAQLEHLIANGQLSKVKDLIIQLHVDGLIIHVNPLQEWTQPEGDRFKVAPIETIKQVLFELETNIIVKEVGQGFGPNSLISLMKLPLAAIDFAGHGGTNFTALEVSRHNAIFSGRRESFQSLAYVGHSASEMIEWVNSNLSSAQIQCKQFIISGGIKDVIQGHKLAEQLNAQSVIGMGSSFLRYAENFEQLDEYTHTQVELLKLAKCYLKGC